MRVFLERGEGAHLTKKIAGVYNFSITRKKGAPPAKTWTIDLKNGNGCVTEGETKTADAGFTMTDNDFDLLCQGKLNP